MLTIHVHEGVRQRARDRAQSPGFEYYRRARRKIEALFVEQKNHIGLRRVRLRRLKFVREQFLLAKLAASAQNLKRLIRFHARPPQSPMVVAG